MSLLQKFKKITRKSKNDTCQHSKYKAWLPLYTTRVSLFSTPVVPLSFSLTLSLLRLHHCLSLYSLTFSNFKFTILISETLIPHLPHTHCLNTPLSHSMCHIRSPILTTITLRSLILILLHARFKPCPSL